MDREILISLGIIGGITAVFGSIGFLCCYFKNKCSTLNEPEPEFRHLRKASNVSKFSQVTQSTETSSYTNRRTLFQIFMGYGTTKPLRANAEREISIRKKRWSNTLSFLRSKRLHSKSRPARCPGRMEDLEEGIETENESKAGCSKIETL